MHLPIVILASSRKNSGICLAGKRLDGATRSWVRPVSTLAGQSWPRRGLQYVAGGVPRLGDCLGLPLIAPCPEGYQRENVGVRFQPWKRQGRIDAADLIQFLDTPEALWPDGWHSIHGWNDRVPVHIALQNCPHSLLFIRPQALRFRVSIERSDLVVRAEFVHGRQRHVLRVTDEDATARWLARLADGHDGRSNALLCLSLAQPFNGFCYKLVAGVVETGAEG
jgi:hypothetical protein